MLRHKSSRIRIMLIAGVRHTPTTPLLAFGEPDKPVRTVHAEWPSDDAKHCDYANGPITAAR